MLSIQQLSKSYGGQILFDDTSLQMERGERLGLIGRNGHGKSTLFRLILGEEHPDDGLIVTPKDFRVGHLEQHLHFTKPTVREEACLGLSAEDIGAEYKAETILFGLGFTAPDLDRAPATFSGGYQIRINLAKLLVSDPDLLLLDEPTNYLDIIAIRWMEKFLRAWRKSLILITHDRTFMDSVTTHTAMIHRHKIRRQPGGSALLIAQLDMEEATYERTRQNEAKQRKHIEEFVNRFKAKASMAARAQSRMKLLEKMPEREKLAFIRSLDFQFPSAPFEAKTLVKADHLAFAYPGGESLFSKLTLHIAPRDRIAIIGRNGRGKSTLLNVLAGELKPSAGVIKPHPNLSLGFFGQSNIDRLNPTLTVEQEIASANNDYNFTAVRTICGVMMFGGDLAKKPVSVLSGGERSRVLLGKILATRTNLLLLDEPTNHLDMSSVEALTESLLDFDGAVVVVTHDEMLLRKLATKLVVFQHGGAEVFDGTYDEFLAKIGWEEEEVKSSARTKSNDAQANNEKKPVVNKKELRRLRAAQLAERSQRIAPLKKEIATLEQHITQRESELAITRQSLIDAAQQNDAAEMATLGKKVKTLETRVANDFERFTVLSAELESFNVSASAE